MEFRGVIDIDKYLCFRDIRQVCPILGVENRIKQKLTSNWGSEREESWCGHPESLQPRCSSKGVVRPKSVIKFVSESASIRRACAYISRRFSCVYWSGFFFETQSAFLIGLESAEGYPLAVDDFPKRGKFPKTSQTMMYSWVHCLLPGVGNPSPFSVG
ncbi:hypothetical protein TNCV_4178471 [Trichonephila clavipes]|nr:hypothetical protein TNCV_4178471 [Trichonephila clavipes]